MNDLLHLPGGVANRSGVIDREIGPTFLFDQRDLMPFATAELAAVPASRSNSFHSKGQGSSDEDEGIADPFLFRFEQQRGIDDRHSSGAGFEASVNLSDHGWMNHLVQ